MTLKIPFKLLLFALLGIILVLATYMADSRSVKPNETNQKIFNSEPYVYGKVAPIDIGEIKNENNAYIHIKLKFYPEDTDGYPNVFQTGPFNEGIRMEISGSTATIIVPDLSAPGGLRGIQLTSTLEKNKWYNLDVEALNGGYVRIKIDGKNIGAYENPNFKFRMSRILVGGGFDPSRQFRGRIDDIEVTNNNFTNQVVLAPSFKFLQWILISLSGIACLIFLITSSNVALLSQANENQKFNELIDATSIYGFFLCDAMIGLIAGYLLEDKYFEMMKWASLILIPVSLPVIIVFRLKYQQIWNFIRWPLSFIFIIYCLCVMGTIVLRQEIPNAYLVAILSFSLIYLAVLFFGVRLNLTFFKHIHISIVSVLSLVALEILLAFTWSTLFELTNWNAFKLSLHNYFGIIAVGSFICIWIILKLLFLSDQKAEVKGLGFFEQLKQASLNGLIYFDVLAIFIFLWISFRHDSLFIATESGSSIYHWEYYVGVIQSIRDGGFLLWDIPSQYGFLNILIPSALPTNSAWQAFYLFQGSLLWIVSILIYVVVNCLSTRSIFNRLVSFAIIFMALFYADPELIGPFPFPSSSVVRFFCAYLLVLVTCIVPRFSIQQAIILSFIWAISVVWSAESAVYGTAIYSFIIFFHCVFNLTWKSPHSSIIYIYLVSPIVFILFILLAIFSFYMAKIAVAPDLFGYIEYAIGYAGGYGNAPFSFLGPGNYLLLAFIGIVLLCLSSLNYSARKHNDIVAPLSAMAGCLWGISSYYIGRPVPQNFTALIPIVGLVVYLPILVTRNINLGWYSVVNKIVALPLFFIILTPMFNPKWIGNLYKIDSFNTNISRKLPTASPEIDGLISQANLFEHKSIVFYGDGDFVGLSTSPIKGNGKFNSKSWLPMPLQLLEDPITKNRRSQYLRRYICRHQEGGGFIISQKYDALSLRFQVFLDELSRYYKINEVGSTNTYALYYFSNLNLSECKP